MDLSVNVDSIAIILPETRTKIARYAIDNGNKKAARHFSKVLNKDINESSVRSIKTSLEGSFMVESLRRSPRGRPVKSGKYDEQVKILKSYDFPAEL